MKSSDKIIEKVKAKIFNLEYKMAHRVSAKDFTRERKMPFASLILFMLNAMKRTLQIELSNFMDLISGKNSITKSAFSQSRLNLCQLERIESFKDISTFQKENIT